MSDTDPAPDRPDATGETAAGSPPPATPEAQTPTPTPPTPPVTPPPPTTVAPPTQPATVLPDPPTTTVTPTTTASRDQDDENGDDHDEDEDDDTDDWDDMSSRDQQAVRWVGMVTSLGVGIVAVIALQVLVSLFQGLTLKTDEYFRNTGFTEHSVDILHRLGLAFSGMGTTSQIFVIVAVVLISLPPVLGGQLTDRQYAMTGIALRVATVVAITLAVGSLLWARSDLYIWQLRGETPQFIRIEHTKLLLGTLTASALAIFASLTAHPLREWDR